MALKHQYDKKEDIPEQYAELYAEKGDKWELTGVSGIKTVADVDRVQAALQKERDEHKATKTKLADWTKLELTPEEVTEKLDKIPELEAASKGKLDEEQIEEIVNRRVDGVIRSKLAPVERQLRDASKERDTLKEERDGLAKDKSQRMLHDTIRPLMNELKILTDHHEDVLLYADRHLEPLEDNSGFQTRDGVGVTPGVTPKDWLEELVQKRPGWLPASQGGGALGSGARPGGGTGKNPWSAEQWNMTEQGRIVTEKGAEVAEKMAKQAGTTVGGMKPKPEKASA